MSVLPTFAVLAVVACVAVACGSNGTNNGDGGSTGSCSDIAKQICEKAATCSAGGDAGVVVVVGPDVEAGVNSYVFTVNSESGCETLVGGGCNGAHAAAFTTSCDSAISNGLQCGASESNGNGLLIPSACWDNI